MLNREIPPATENLSLLNPDTLPIIGYGEEIVDSVITSPVTIITAETGAGKSTQVPQMLAEAGYEVVVTQPRIVAARTLAQRVSEERGTKFGEKVGYVTAKERAVSALTDITFCTDGLQVLRSLTERRRPDNAKPQVLVLDEVHEWNTNMEVLVAWAKQKAEADPDNFKVVLMSATMEAEQLSEYFGDSHSSSVIEVPGRTFEVDKTHVLTGSEIDDILTETVNQATAKAQERKNTLVFLPGKNEIEQVVNRLRNEHGQDFEIVPLHGGLSKEEQSRAFSKSSKPKIVVSTNVAQTSVTIPDIDAVIDTGLERRIEVNEGVEGLFLKPTSQADCLQRAGRAGRTKRGEYVLVSPQSLEQRPQFPIPEIMRSRLDKTVLRLASHGFDAAKLDFFHQPDTAEIKLAKTTLHNMGALGTDGAITEIGIEMDRYPVEAHYARMLVEAKKHGVEDVMAMIIANMDTGDIRWRDSSEKWGQHMLPSLRCDALSILNLFVEGIKASRAKLIDDLGISRKTFERSMTKYKQLKRALQLGEDLDPDRIQSILKDDKAVESLKKSIAAGMIDRLYRIYDDDWYQDANGKQRLLGRSSTLRSGSEWIVGDPLDISTRRDRVLSLVQNITAVEPEWLMELAPHLVSLDPRPFRNIGFSATGQPLQPSVLKFAGHSVKNEDLPIESPDDETKARIEEALWMNLKQYPGISHYLDECSKLSSYICTFNNELAEQLKLRVKTVAIEKMRRRGSLNLNHLLAHPPSLQPDEVFNEEIIAEIESIRANFPTTINLGGEEISLSYDQNRHYGSKRIEASLTLNPDQALVAAESGINHPSDMVDIKITVIDPENPGLFIYSGTLEGYRRKREEDIASALSPLVRSTEEVERSITEVASWERRVSCIYAATEIQDALGDLGFEEDDIDAHISEYLKNGSLTQRGAQELSEYSVPDWIKNRIYEELPESINGGVMHSGNARPYPGNVVIARSLPGGGYIEVITNSSGSGSTDFFYLRFVNDQMPDDYPVLDDDLSSEPSIDRSASHNPEDDVLDFSGLESLGRVGRL